MPTAIDVRANENAEYTNTVINKAAEIIEEMAATKQDWSAVTALEQAGREFRNRNRNRNGHGELHFTVQAVINTLNRHFAAAEEEHNKQSQSPLEARAPGCSAETVATTLREAAPKVAKYVHGWTIRTEQTLLEMAQLPITEEDIKKAVRETEGKQANRGALHNQDSTTTLKVTTLKVKMHQGKHQKGGKQ